MRNEKDKGDIISIVFNSKIDIPMEADRIEKQKEFEEKHNKDKPAPPPQEIEGVMASWGIDETKFEIFRPHAERIMRNKKCQLKWNIAKAMGEFDERLDERFIEKKDDMKKKEMMCKDFKRDEFLGKVQESANELGSLDQAERSKEQECE